MDLEFSDLSTETYVFKFLNNISYSHVGRSCALAAQLPDIYDTGKGESKEKEKMTCRKVDGLSYSSNECTTGRCEKTG